VPGETWPGVVGELEGLGREVERAFPGLAIVVRRAAGGMATLDHLPLEISAEHPLVEAAAAAGREARGAELERTSFPAWTDGALLSAFAGIPTLVCGPGDLARAHSPQEALPVAELFDAAAIYLETARRFCAGSGA
jgi:acetylornithine deacetylase/succinyl-diaminopimelate desuccinylase-like protein